MSSNWFSMGNGAQEVPSDMPRRRPNAELKIDREAHPGWSTGAERDPKVGDEIRCAAGPGEIAAILGKTSNGSRLLEIRLDDPDAEPFYAAASNVLISPNPPRPRPAPPEPARAPEPDDDSDEWIG